MSDENTKTVAANGSLLNQVRERRTELKTNRLGTIEIPGYNGMLYARYQGLPWERMKKIAENAQKSKSPRADINAACDSLAAACVSILVLDDNELKSVTGTDEEVRYDDKLAQLLDITPADNARQIIIGLFPSELAITHHFVDFTEFQNGADAEVDEEVIDEFEAGNVSGKA